MLSETSKQDFKTLHDMLETLRIKRNQASYDISVGNPVEWGRQAIESVEIARFASKIAQERLE